MVWSVPNNVPNFEKTMPLRAHTTHPSGRSELQIYPVSSGLERQTSHPWICESAHIRTFIIEAASFGIQILA